MINDSMCFCSIAKLLRVDEQITQNEVGSSRRWCVLAGLNMD